MTVKIHACEILQKRSHGPKKVKRPCCMILCHEGVGWPERERKEWREKETERDLQHTHRQIWSVCSAGLFLVWGNGQKSCRNTAESRKKLYALICHYKAADCLLNRDDSICPSFSHYLISLPPFCLWCTERQLCLMLHLLCQCSRLNAALHMPCGRQ